jgi:hypothetical protein
MTTPASEHLASTYPQTIAKRRKRGARCATLWLAEREREQLTRLVDKLHELTGRKVSMNLILRAGIGALDDLVNRVQVERSKRQPTESDSMTSRGKLETGLLWLLASTAKAVPAGDQE